MFSSSSLRIRDGLAVMILVSALMGVSSPAALGAPSANIADKGGGVGAAVDVSDEPSQSPVETERTWSRMLPFAV